MPNIIQGTCSWLLCFCISCLLSSLFANPMATSFSSGSSGRLGDFHSRCTILLTLSYTHTHTHTHTHTVSNIHTYAWHRLTSWLSLRTNCETSLCTQLVTSGRHCCHDNEDSELVGGARGGAEGSGYWGQS